MPAEFDKLQRLQGHAEKVPGFIKAFVQTKHVHELLVVPWVGTHASTRVGVHPHFQITGRIMAPV